MILSGKLLFKVLIGGKAKPTSIGEKLWGFASFVIIYVTKVGITKKKEKRKEQTKSPSVSKLLVFRHLCPIPKPQLKMQ